MISTDGKKAYGPQNENIEEIQRITESLQNMKLNLTQVRNLHNNKGVREVAVSTAVATAEPLSPLSRLGGRATELLLRCNLQCTH